MQNEQMIQPFGYTEMYEWAKIPTMRKLGSFVQFSPHYPNKIELYDGTGVFLGISSICSAHNSDDPEEWHGKYACDSVGDIYMKEETLAVGTKVYDQDKEFSYIETKPWKHYIKINSPMYNDKNQYSKRSSRKEWVRVNILGKTIVNDNGKCKPGDFCTPYTGDDMEFIGTAIPATNDSEIKFYVLERISDSSIMITNNYIH